MNLRSKRRLAADVLGVGKDRIIFDPEAQDLIQDAITRSTIRGLVGMGGIKVAPEKGISRGRARAKHRKGKSRGHGSLRGAKTRAGPQGRRRGSSRSGRSGGGSRSPGSRNEMTKDELPEALQTGQGRPGEGSEAPDGDDEGVAGDRR